MTKQERQDWIANLLELEIEHSEIIETVTKEAKVSEATVKRDIKEVLGAPEGDENPNDGNSADEGDKTITIELTEAEKTNAELRKGRRTSYVVPSNERDTVHAEIEKVQFRRGGNGAGTKSSKPTVQKFDIRAWLKFRKNAKSLGYSHVRVLYAPENLPEKDRSVVQVKEGEVVKV